jgi:PAS domain S-box-containing protein
MTDEDRRSATDATPALDEGGWRIGVMLRGSNIGAWDATIARGRITGMRHWGESFGYGDSSAGLDWDKVLHPDERESIVERSRRFAGGEIDSFELEHRLRDSSGEWRWVLSRGRVIGRDGRGRPERAVGVFLDITDQKRAQRALRESEERYRTLIESATDAISVVDEDGVFQFLNAQAARRLGGRPEDFVGRTMAELFPPEVAESQLMNVREVIRTRQGMVRDSVTVLQGETRMYHTSLQPLEQAASGRPAALVVARDITQRRKHEEELTSLNEELTARANQLRTLASELTLAEQRERQRVSEILHDHVQQTLAAAKLRLGLLRGHVPGAESQALLEQVGDLLSVSIAAVRTLAVELSPPILKEASLTAALGWLADEFWKQHGLKVRVETDPRSDGSAEDTRIFLFQAVRELLFNVTKHAGAGTAFVRLNADQDRLQLSVTDSGAGFDPASVTQPMSMGLGLFSIRERAEALGGSLSVDAAPGRGTRVTLTVPAEAGAR